MENPKRYVVTISETLHRRLKVEAARKGCQLTFLVEQILIDGIKPRREGKEEIQAGRNEVTR